MSGKVERIWIKRIGSGPLDEVQSAAAVAGSGLVGNYRQGGRRQVTVLSAEAWNAVQQELSTGLDPVLRRANVLVSGVDLADSKDRILQVGTTVLLIRGETKPCNIMEEACPGLREALLPNWRGGAYGEVLRNGEIRVGDAVEWKEHAEVVTA